ncbi:hypothetical protein [Enterobacter hormaechei]|mgnify:FL=1|jgi:hypothetical protein|uniref:hypothetical protein n=1 Tax=Enterobacter hormaechei TaxID=158836 RepID=UPI0005A8C8C0|nr:hypothetical protein [Enterobacter hormaechei]
MAFPPGRAFVLRIEPGKLSRPSGLQSLTQSTALILILPVFSGAIVPVGALAAARPTPQHPDKSRPARRYAPARPLNRAVVTGHCSGGGIV